MHTINSGRGLVAALVLAGCTVERERATEPECVPDGERVVCSRVHAPGILDTASPDHHARLLRETAYRFDQCGDCHGQDLRGGTSEKTCWGCHEAGPTACVTCHEKLPQQGAHAAHLAGATVATPRACATCHTVPDAWDAPGHLRLRRDVLDPSPVEVRFDPRASAGAPAGAEASFDAPAQTCRNVTCHGALIPAGGTVDPAPRWTEPHVELGCARCHGAPPPTAYHAEDACQTCHGRVVDAARAIVDPALHMDGRVDLGPDGSGRCEACHAAIPSEPMHQAHLSPALRLGGALRCSACHLEPATVTAPGHLDSRPPVEVFPPGHTGAAWARSSTPTWDRQAGSCSSTWCHGRDNTVRWQRFPAQIVCGACHGVPPADAAHEPQWTVRECARCHDSVDAYGNPILVETAEGLRSRHLDGEVDVR